MSEVREKFPQYPDLPDEKLLEAVHSKFYSDIPIETFTSNVIKDNAAWTPPTEGTDWIPTDVNLQRLRLENEVKDEARAKALEKQSFAKDLIGEGISLATVVAATPEFVAKIGQQSLIEPVKQLASTGTLDWGKAREDAARIVSPLGIPARGLEKFADYIGVGDEYKNSVTNKTLNNLTEGMEWISEKVEQTTGLDKEGSMAVLESLMITGLPGVKPVGRALKSKVGNLATDTKVGVDLYRGKKTDIATADRVESIVNPSTKDIAISLAEDNKGKVLIEELDLPEIPTSDGAFADSLYELNGRKKADETIVAELELKFEELGVPMELREKFRRYTEETAVGNELINNNIDTLKESIRNLHEENSLIYAEGDLKSIINPEGKTLWKDLPNKDRVAENKKTIKELELDIEKERLKYDRREQLNPWEQRVYNETVGPQLKTITDLSTYIQKEGLVPKLNMNPKEVGGYAPRIGRFDSKGLFQSIKDSLSGDRAGLSQEYTSSIVPSAASERAIFVHELPDKTRKVITFIGDSILEWKNKKSKKYANRTTEDLKAGDSLGIGKIKEATKDEIELNTPFTYSNNFTAVTGIKTSELRDFARTNKFIKSWMESDHFKKVAHKVEGSLPIPDGFVRPEFLDKTPQLREYAFDPRVAEMLEDFNRSYDNTGITTASNMLIKNMMLNPVPHMHNELVHWYLARGASGIIDPRSIESLYKTFPDAVAEVVGRGDFYQQLLREGASVMSANIKNNIILEKALDRGIKEVVADPRFQEFAKTMGRKPAEMYDAISAQSNKAMWTMRDILYVQLVKESMARGATMREAIKSVERHMPNYRIPSRVGEKVLGAKMSRGLSKTLQNPSWTVFSRYKHGMISSFLNGTKDILMLDPAVKKSKQFRDGMDYMVALAALQGLIYPLFDSLWQGITGDESAKVRRAGVTHVFNAIKEVAGNEKDFYAITSSLITGNPIAMALFQLAINRQLYSGKNVFNPEDDWDIILDDLGNYTISLVPQAAGAMRVQSEKGGGFKQWLLKQLDVKTQTLEQRYSLEDRKDIKQSAAENRRDEEAYGL